MSHSCAYFQSSEMVRTIDDMWSRQPGCHSQPFFSIHLENVILDELHLMLRITDRLEEGLIFEILKWDKVWLFVSLIVSLFLVSKPAICSHFAALFCSCCLTAMRCITTLSQITSIWYMYRMITTREAGKRARFTFKTSYQWCGPWVWASASTRLLTSGNGRLSWEGKKSFFWENFLTTSTRLFPQRRWRQPKACGM